MYIVRAPGVGPQENCRPEKTGSREPGGKNRIISNICQKPRDVSIYICILRIIGRSYQLPIHPV